MGILSWRICFLSLRAKSLLLEMKIERLLMKQPFFWLDRLKSLTELELSVPLQGRLSNHQPVIARKRSFRSNLNEIKTDI